MAGKFYAVKEGRNIGIFESWIDCKKQAQRVHEESFAETPRTRNQINKVSRIKKRLEAGSFVDIVVLVFNQCDE